MMKNIRTQFQQYPSLNNLINAILNVWPDHEKHLNRLFEENENNYLVRVDEVASLALKLIGDNLEMYCLDYKWMCKNFVQEALYFKRHDEYRLKTFKEANDQIYSNKDYMDRYVRGILISQIMWENHTRSIDLFQTEFLVSAKSGYDYLEIGPGHGLFFYFATKDKRHRSLTGWDVSHSSIKATTHAMEVFSVEKKKYTLVHQDILKSSGDENCFDMITISEVLEHLETPKIALESLYKVLRPEGKIFINIPVNSPAPDHLYLWRTTESVIEFVESVGFKVTKDYYFPPTGCSLSRAKKHNLDISCVIMATK